MGMQTSSFDTRFSVVCLPENPRLFMLNMQVFHIEPSVSAKVAQGEERPDAMVWCAIYQPLVARKH
jgi:hypothetical protein